MYFIPLSRLDGAIFSLRLHLFLARNDWPIIHDKHYCLHNIKRVKDAHYMIHY